MISRRTIETSVMISHTLSKGNRTYSFERSFTRWFQQLQTDFCHFHHSCCDHSASRRKPLALLHVASRRVDVTAGRPCSRQQHVSSVTSPEPVTFYNVTSSLLLLLLRRTTTRSVRQSATFEMPTARRPRCTARGTGRSRVIAQNVRLTAVGYLAQQLNAPSQRTDATEIRSRFIDYRRQPDQPRRTRPPGNFIRQSL